MSFVTSSMHIHDTTNERTLSDPCANNALERSPSNYQKLWHVSFGVDDNQVMQMT